MTHRIPHTVPAQVSFPEPLTNPADPRLKHRIQLWDGQGADAVLLGVPFDLGVELGGGRPGAAGGPTAFREALRRFGTTYDAEHDIEFDHLHLADAGDLEVTDDVAATHQRLTESLTAILDGGTTVVTFGGGHDATFGSVQALMNKYPSVAGINVDAHLDMREVENGRISSGTPFRRILEDLHLPGENLVEFGLHANVNSHAHLNYALEKGVKCWTRGQLREPVAATIFSDELQQLSNRANTLFVSLDLDVFAAAYAPGVSAPGTEGLTPEEGRQLAFAAGRHPGVRRFELMELNPRFDVDLRTSRLAVMLLCAFLAGLATRRTNPARH
ncbi:MAG: formimidoylglutamase [Fidelibacterota bacterium]|nr:MAG: formimidoylglutamase [Candidatus Neomarinimicrobiota bacterium]